MSGSVLPTVLRFLQGTGFKNEEARAALIRHFEWRERELPACLSPDIIAALVNLATEIR